MSAMSDLDITLGEMVTAYVVAALWSTTGDDGEPLDDWADAYDIADQTLEEMHADCADFLTANYADCADLMSRGTGPDWGITIHEHGIAGAVIRTHRTHRVSPAGWVYNIRRDDWSEVGYTRTQREALQVAIGRLCRAVDAGEVSER